MESKVWLNFIIHRRRRRFHTCIFLPSFLHQSLDLCQCCANLGVPVVAANGWAAMKAIVLRNLSARRAARRRVEIFVWTVDDERQGSGDSVTGAPSPLQGDPSPRKPGLG